MTNEQAALIAAQEWARAHAPRRYNPAQFGTEVMSAYLAARAAFSHQGDVKTMAAALAALSVPSEVLRALGPFVAPCQRLPDIPASAADASGQGQ